MITLENRKALRRIDILGNRRLTFALRLSLGIPLLVFGVSKLLDMAAFADTVITYRVLPVALAEVYAAVLPWAEVVIGICLILGLGLRFITPVAILVIASFIAGTSGNLYWVGTGVRTCSCLSGFDWPLGTSHLLAQVIMLAMTTQIFLHKGEFISLDSWLSKRRYRFCFERR